ncbi:MAG: DUF3576 domain-containing protein [Aquisalinus sp.]|nr:DUF3576 domain-containing protein [Aquisalinus sp.]
MKPETKRLCKILGMACGAAILAACASNNNAAETSKNAALPSYSLDNRSGAVTSVNRYLWSASLETLNFMPVFSADPIGGIIITDWFANPNVPNERLKANIYILDTTLRADALRVSVFKQQYTGAGWQDAPVNPATAREIENAILTRARQLRLNSVG